MPRSHANETSRKIDQRVKERLVWIEQTVVYLYRHEAVCGYVNDGARSPLRPPFNGF